MNGLTMRSTGKKPGPTVTPARWVVDGIDGTSDFIEGSPLWGTLIALIDDDVPVLGLSTSIGQQRRWWATTGEGAWTAVLHDFAVGSAGKMSQTRLAALGRT